MLQLIFRFRLLLTLFSIFLLTFKSFFRVNINNFNLHNLHCNRILKERKEKKQFFFQILNSIIHMIKYLNIFHLLL